MVADHSIIAEQAMEDLAKALGVPINESGLYKRERSLNYLKLLEEKGASILEDIKKIKV